MKCLWRFSCWRRCWGELCVSSCVQVVPFRETPSYTKRRRVGATRTPAGNGLSSPRSLIRSASDNALESPASSPGPSLQSLETHHDSHTHSLRRHPRRLRYAPLHPHHAAVWPPPLTSVSPRSPGGGGHAETSPPSSPPHTPQMRKRRLYSAVPGRTFIATRSHVPQGSGEIQLHRGERVKGQWETKCSTLVLEYKTLPGTL